MVPSPLRRKVAPTAENGGMSGRGRCLDRFEGRPRQLPAATLPALASVLVVRPLPFSRDVPGSQVDHLCASPSREDQREDDRTVPSARDGIRYGGEEPADIV